MKFIISGDAEIKLRSGEMQVISGGDFGLESGGGFDLVDGGWSCHGTWKAFGDEDSELELLVKVNSAGLDSFELTARDCKVVKNDLEYDVRVELPLDDE